MAQTLKLTKIYLNTVDGVEAEGIRELQLRADFNNDRHHLVVIRYPHGTVELADALHSLAANIMRDKELNDA